MHFLGEYKEEKGVLPSFFRRNCHMIHYKIKIFP